MSNTYAWVFGNIRVDPTDENTIYTLALGVSVSRDGGKTFGRIGAAAGRARRRRRPAAGGRGGGAGGDNHGMWIDPKNPHFIVLGNDSGFRVSTDGGQTWRRADLPMQTVFSMSVRHGHAVPGVRDRCRITAAIAPPSISAAAART